MATQTFTLKQGDTGPAIRATLKGADGTAQDLTGATIAFNMRKDANTIVIDHGACVVVGTVTNGVVEYQPSADDTANIGTFSAEFEATLGNGEVVTFPNSNSFAVKIVQAVA